MNTRFKWLFLLLLFAAPAFSQNVRVDNVTFSSVQGFPFLPGATITVCTAAGTGLPCTPTVAGTCLSISDVTCNQSATLTSDAFGNYGFWIQPGSYTYTVTKAGFGGFGPRALTLACQPTATCTMTAPQTINANLTVSGALQCKNLENVLCIDAGNSQNWTGSDIGGWFNSAYAAASTTGPEIWHSCNQSGARLNFSTPMVFQTSGKYVAPRAIGPTDQNGNGCGLNYTPTTATTAMTLDYTPVGGGGYEPGDLFGIHLINNGCVGTGGTNGGCGSSATGIKFGTTNGGAHMLKIHGRVAGFGTGIDFHDANGIGWGVGFEQFGCAWNTTCLSFPIYHENIHWVGGACAVNTTCISNSSGSDIEMFGVSVDSNLSASGWINPTGQISCVACHFENLGPNNAAGTQPFLISGQSGGVYNFSGVAINDNANVGSLAALFSATAGTLYWTGQITSPNQTITNVYNNSAGAVGHLSYFTANAANVGPACATPFYCVVERFGYAGGPNLDVPIFRQPLDVLGTVTGQASYVVCHMDAVNADWRCSYNGGSFFRVPLTGAANTWSAAQSFGANQIVPTSAGLAILGSTALPVGTIQLGTAATNNFAITPAATTQAVTINIADPGTPTVNMALVLKATSAAFATATTAGTCVQNTTAVTGAATTMAVAISPVSTPGVGAQWSAFVSSAGNVTINECAVATSTGGTIAFNIRVFP